MTKHISIIAVLAVSLLFAVAAFAADGNINPASDDAASGGSVQPASDQQQVPATPVWQTREGQEEATRRVLSGELNGKNGRDGKNGHNGRNGRNGHDGRTVTIFRQLAEIGGPASGWAKGAVDGALARGPQKGGLSGRTKGANSSSDEWRKSATRQELATVAGRSATYADELMSRHNGDSMAHPALRGRANWALGIAILALLIGIGGYFFPRMRMPRTGGY